MILGRLQIWLVALVVWGCGRSVERVPSPSGNDAGSSATGGTGGSGETGGTDVTDTGGGSGVTGGMNGGSAPEGGSGGASASGGASTAGGMGGLGSMLLCPGPNYVSLKGELPGFGTDLTFSAGCPGSRITPYPTAASFTLGRGRLVHVEIDACSDDGTQEVSLSVYFQGDTSGQTTLTGATFNFSHVNADGTTSTPPLTATVSVTETTKPVMNWIDTIGDPSAGVGAKYEGSFSVDGSTGSTPVHLTGTFSVCHVKNLPDDSV